MKASFIALTVFLVACAASTPPPTRYLLPADVPEGTVRVDPPVRIGISKLVVAPYLSQRGLVVETEKRQIRAARQHQWAEPLAAGLRRQLRAQLSKALGFDVSADPTQRTRWDFVIDVSIERLHGTLDGDAVLVAHWRVTPTKARGDAASYRIARSQPLPRAGYGGLVDAEISLIDGLAGEIAASLAGLSDVPSGERP
jgi:hypothetical protein